MNTIKKNTEALLATGREVHLQVNTEKNKYNETTIYGFSQE
jgi:hypothetical protein